MKGLAFFSDLILICSFTVLINCQGDTRDPASNQLLNYKNSHNEISGIQTDFGAPVDDFSASLTVGPNGPALLQDFVSFETIARFTRERIPPRTDVAKGAGAFGYFVVTNDITNYSKAVVFSHVGKKTRIVCRFTILPSELGSAETNRGGRGFSIKFYTEDGNWDLLSLTFPTIFVKDPLQFISLVQSTDRNPVTNLLDADMRWDFLTLNPQGISNFMFLSSDSGIPDGFRQMDTHAINIFKMVNNEGVAVYVRFHCFTNQGIRNLSPELGANLTALDPDYATRDLYNAIASGNFPSWTVAFQVMTYEMAERYPENPFDISREWPEKLFPYIEIGKVVLTENPRNFFADVEQAAYCPGNLIPGIEIGPDRLLQSRVVAYTDAQRYRLGTNFLQIPINRPIKRVTNYHRHGTGVIDNQDGAPTYFPNSFGGPGNVGRAAISVESVSGDIGRYNNTVGNNFDRAVEFWNSLTEDHKNRTATNIGRDLALAAQFLQRRAIDWFVAVDIDFARRVKSALNEAKRQ